MRKNTVFVCIVIAVMLLLTLSACSLFDSVVAYERVTQTKGTWKYEITALEGFPSTDFGWKNDCRNNQQDKGSIKQGLKSRYSHTDCAVISCTSKFTGNYNEYYSASHDEKDTQLIDWGTYSIDEIGDGDKFNTYTEEYDTHKIKYYEVADCDRPEEGAEEIDCDIYSVTKIYDHHSDPIYKDWCEVKYTDWIHAERKVNGESLISPITITGTTDIPVMPTIKSHKGDKQIVSFSSTVIFGSISGDYLKNSYSENEYTLWMRNPTTYCAGIDEEGRIVRIEPVENMETNECFKEGQNEH